LGNLNDRNKRLSDLFNNNFYILFNAPVLLSFFFFAEWILAGLTFAKFSAWNTTLKAFAILLLTLWFLASASLLMINKILLINYFLSDNNIISEGIWIAIFGSLNDHLSFFFIGWGVTTTIAIAVFAVTLVGEAFAV
jgi:hypothetical protein